MTNRSGLPLAAKLRGTITTQFVVLLAAGCSILYAEDWPAYLHDNARSGVTAEQLPSALSQKWVFQPLHGPDPAWDIPQPKQIEGYYELPRIRFDDAFHVSAAGDAIYFGSSGDNKVYCLDAGSGRVRWTFFTGGPVRFAPALEGPRLYACSDDGFVYCLNASDGNLVWKHPVAPHGDRVLGNGRMISLWPPRTGVLVDDGKVYVTAGFFPAEGIYVYALNARDGSVVWCNDGTGDIAGGQGGLSLQGYLLASKTTLFAPMGRVSPVAFDRKDGRLVYGRPFFGKGTGGTYALLADEEVISGSEMLVAYGQKSPRRRFAWFPGRKLVIHGGTAYMASDYAMWALDRKAYGAASLKWFATESKLTRLPREISKQKRARAAAAAKVKQGQKTLAALDGQLVAVAAQKKQQTKQLAELKAKRQAQAKTVNALKRDLEAATKKLAALQAQHKRLLKQAVENDAAMAGAMKWRLASRTAESLILAGNTLFAGGKDAVIAVDANAGDKHWEAKVDGKARGLAVANGRLFVSTDTGAIYCFAGPKAPPQGKSTPRVASPYRSDALAPVFRAAAETIVKSTGIKRGYCLVLGAGTGRLALELARRTDLRIYGVEPDAAKAAKARRVLDAAGVYGARVCIDSFPLSKVPYADYFANLIVSESALFTGRMPGEAKEVFRMLKPFGGVAYLGQPANVGGRVKRLWLDTLWNWVKDSGIEDDVQLIDKRGRWLKITRGPLAGAGSWTQEYANPGNTACSLDKLVRCPLGVLWFGSPGPTRMPSRHASVASPLSLDGRMFVEGENVIMAFDAYNGLHLWSRELPGVTRLGTKHGEGGNMALSEKGLFAAVGSTCLRLDAATGETKAVYHLPLSPQARPEGGILKRIFGPPPQTDKRKWGYAAAVGNTLFGSVTTRGRTSNSVFAVQVPTGECMWVYRGKDIMHTTIAIGDGTVFLVDRAVTDAHRRTAVEERFEILKKLGEAPPPFKKALASDDVRLVVALDAETGEKRWERSIDVTGCVRISSGGGELNAIYYKKILLLCTAPHDGHFWKQFLDGKFSRRTAIVLRGDNGKLLWTKRLGYRHRPLVVDGTLIAEPWAYDLRTGKPKMRRHPFTRELVRWQMARPGHHCGAISASAAALFFRSYTDAYYDLVRDFGTVHFGAIRPGCWINLIPASGVLLAPEASSGCMCPFPNMCTVVLKPRRTNRAWGMYSCPGKQTPVRHMAVNLGAPGDRRDNQGTLWLSYPRPHGGATPDRVRLVFQFKFTASILRGLGYFYRNPETAGITGTDKPWVFSSGCCGLRRCTLHLLDKGQPSASYTVRLGFADPVSREPGKRPFDVKVQGKTALKDFDIVAAAGGWRRAVVREFPNVQVNDDLVIEFVPKVEKPDTYTAPLLNSIEVFMR